ncbi:hypothetical protein TRVL_08616 [Trypanosoma vivax]|nr:hypothetical protein TRVL_08616 [Trypanosoma vivax]
MLLKRSKPSLSSCLKTIGPFPGEYGEAAGTKFGAPNASLKGPKARASGPNKRNSAKTPSNRPSTGATRIARDECGFLAKGRCRTANSPAATEAVSQASEPLQVALWPFVPPPSC